MATSKKEAGNKTATAVNKAAINKFPKAKIITALNTLADCKTAEGAAQGEAVSASLNITRLAADYGIQAHKIANGDTTTVLADWKENVRAMALELAAAGSPFAETSLNKAGETIGKLTGTGNNVLSIAKGVVDFQLVVDDCTNEEGEVSYRSVRAAVEAARAERRALQNPEEAALAEAKQAARDAWKELSSTVFSTNDIDLVETLTAAITEMADDQKAASKVIAELNEKAEQEKAA